MVDASRSVDDLAHRLEVEAEVLRAVSYLNPAAACELLLDIVLKVRRACDFGSLPQADPELTPDVLDVAEARRESGETSLDVARSLGVTKGTLNRALRVRAATEDDDGSRAASDKASHGDLVRAGQDRAKASGVHVGRPNNPALTEDVVVAARARLAGGERLRDVARSLRVPRSTLHRAVSAGEVDPPTAPEVASDPLASPERPLRTAVVLDLVSSGQATYRRDLYPLVATAMSETLQESKGRTASCVWQMIHTTRSLLEDDYDGRLSASQREAPSPP